MVEAEDSVAAETIVAAVVSEAAEVVLLMAEAAADSDVVVSVDRKETEMVSEAETIITPVTEVEKEVAADQTDSAAVDEAAEGPDSLPVAEVVSAVRAMNSMARDVAETDSGADHPDLEIYINDNLFATTRRLVLFD